MSRHFPPANRYVRLGRRLGLHLIISSSLLFSGSARSDSSAPPPSVPEIFKYGRPADLFKLVFARSTGVCDAINAELSTPNAGEPARDYFALLSATTSNAHWTLLDAALSPQKVRTDFALADIYNDGIARLVFRPHGLLGGREFDALYVDPANDTANVSQALQHIAPNGGLNTAFAVAPGNTQDYYDSAGLPGSDVRGLLRFDVARVDGTTYVVEGSFYELATFDALLFYRGHPERTFTLECAFDPVTTLTPLEE